MKHCRCTVSVYGVHWQGNVNVYLNHDKNFFASISEGINLFTEVCEGNVFTGVCLSTGRGVCIGVGVCQGGVCIRRSRGGLHLVGSASRGFGQSSPGSTYGGVGQPPPPRHMGYYGIWSTSRQYTSYYNAFLLYLNLPPPTHTHNEQREKKTAASFTGDIEKIWIERGHILGGPPRSDTVFRTVTEQETKLYMILQIIFTYLEVSILSRDLF